MSSPLLEFKNVGKWFGNCCANKDVSFQVQVGSIHALIGENGAGKSTVMKMLFGMFKPDSGEILFEGRKVEFNSPNDSKKLGIGMVQQHFMLADAIPALDHLFLEDHNIGWNPFKLLSLLSRQKYHERAEEISKKFRMETPWQSLVKNLSVGYQQRVELLKLLFHDARILILDEPTAVLSPLEVETLLEHLRMLKAKGLTIIIITHKLNEVFAVADSVTVLRKGQSIFTGSLEGQTQESLASMMVGQNMDLNSTFERTQTELPQKACLWAKNLSVHQKETVRVDNASFEVFPGEIVGVAGVEGQGQSEILKLFAGGTLEGHHIQGEYSKISRKDLGFVAEDRLSQAVVSEMSVAENFLLGHEESLLQGQFIPWSDLESKVREQIKKFDVQPLDPTLPLESLSGGNQQKVVIARELSNAPKVMVVAQPTRGVDFAASATIHNALMKARNQGTGILLISSDLPELLKLSDRLLVMNKGQIRGNFSRADFNSDKIASLMGGVQ